MSGWRAIAIWVGTVALAATSCVENREKSGMENEKVSRITKELFGTLPDGTSIDIYTLTNADGWIAKITNYGGIVVALEVPDRNGKRSDVVLGFDSLAPYLNESPYFGALIGRYGNRIGGARFTLEGKEYGLAANNGENHLHGGLEGFDKVVWEAEVLPDGLKLAYLSRDGEEGYPGNLAVEVIYRLTDDNELRIDYNAATDEKTVVNLTHHSYFNLENGGAGDVLGHELMLAADRFTPVNRGLIPTGELRSVEGTPMDFRESATIGARIDQDDEQLRFGGGYDHNWVLNHRAGELSLAARVYEPATGRIMEVYTTEPGLQFYSGNFLDGSRVGKRGIPYEHRSGLCLEAQHFPDSPNKPDFPSTVLEPGDVYRQTTIYKFSTK